MKKFLNLLVARSIVSTISLLAGLALMSLLMWQVPTASMFWAVLRGGVILGFIWAYFENALTKAKPKKHWGSNVTSNKD